VSRAVKALLSAAFCALILLPAGALADEQRIAQGVSAGGVDLSNLTVPDAAALLEQRLGGPLAAPVAVHVAGRHFHLTAKTAKVRFDALRTAKRAYYAGVNRPETPPSGGGATSGTTVPLAVSHAHLVVRAFAGRVARSAAKRARDASVRITVRHVYARHSQTGRRVDANALAESIDAALDDPALPRELFPKPLVVRPRVTVGALARIYSTIITVDRAHFTLRLFKHLRVVKRYGIAVGQAGLETPPGRYRIRDKQVNPAWHVPHSAWAGSLAGHVIPGGAPGNPLKARWLGIANGVGIHGTAEDWSIGTAASHGCIRMHVSDVIALYPRVPVGTPVLIH
jgi:lipoprotein-anchoring transpeptidase ErfK/SrfK